MLFLQNILTIISYTYFYSFPDKFNKHCDELGVSRNFEIGVRKAFGHSEGNILSMIFKQMLLLFSIAAVFAVLIHFLSFKVLGSFVSLPEVFLPEVFLLEAFLLSLVSAFILTVTTVIFVSFKTLAVQPIEALRS